MRFGYRSPAPDGESWPFRVATYWLPALGNTPPQEQRVLYGSTNRALEIALYLYDRSQPWAWSVNSVVAQPTELLPLELQDLMYEPAEQLVVRLAAFVFAQRGNSGLMLSGQGYTFDSWVAGDFWDSSDPDRSALTFELQSCNVLDSVNFIYHVLRWLPRDRDLEPWLIQEWQYGGGDFDVSIRTTRQGQPDVRDWIAQTFSSTLAHDLARDLGAAIKNPNSNGLAPSGHAVRGDQLPELLYGAVGAGPASWALSDPWLYLIANPASVEPYSSYKGRWKADVSYETGDKVVLPRGFFSVLDPTIPVFRALRPNVDDAPLRLVFVSLIPLQLRIESSDNWEALPANALMGLKDVVSTHRTRALEGAPQLWNLTVGTHGAVARSFELLDSVGLHAPPDQLGFADFARRSAVGLFERRLQKDRYLMPTVAAPLGAWFEWGSDRRQYETTTDSLYLAHPLFDAYTITNPGPTRALQLSGRNALLDDIAKAARRWPRWLQQLLFGGDPVFFRVKLRREQLARFRRQFDDARNAQVQSTGSSASTDPLPPSPEPTGWYLIIALGQVLDWIRLTYDPRWRHFVTGFWYGDWNADTPRRMPRDLAAGDFSGDSLYNTLRMLVEAFRATYDDFYLELFLECWKSWSNTSFTRSGGSRSESFRPAIYDAEGRVVDLSTGLIASAFTAGHVTPNPHSHSVDEGCVNFAAQAGFFTFITEAWFAAAVAGSTHENELRSLAVTFADRAERALSVPDYYQASTIPSPEPPPAPIDISGPSAPTGRGWLLLAMLTGPPVRVTISSDHEFSQLEISTRPDFARDGTWSFNVPVPPAARGAEFPSPQTVGSAVIYMDPGEYYVRVTTTSGEVVEGADALTVPAGPRSQFTRDVAGRDRFSPPSTSAFRV